MIRTLLFFSLFSFAIPSWGASSQSAAPKAAAKATSKTAVAKEEEAVPSSTPPVTAAAAIEDPEIFHKKLVEMYDRTEKSIKLLREQIIQNQSAPFLADLYLQLGDLLSEKANVLYYEKIEKDKDSNIKLNPNEKANPIVTTEQEAIAIYQQILKEFPSFPHKDKVLYRLAVARKAIDDAAPFVVTAEELMKSYPSTKESMQVRLLLGQYYIDQHELSEAGKVLGPAKDCPYPFERNSARHRLGIIAMSDEKFKEALSLFEKVATDEELKEEDNPLEISIKKRTVQSNVKRDALIDSIRAYTEVYKKDADPIGFYSRIAPSETLFQETIEKLAFRYIFLKNELQAMKLLRNLSERAADPQKVVNIYREVLTIIPPIERIEVPPSEMQYVLEKYAAWVQNFEIPEKTRSESYRFFETQIREMGTRAHDLAKSELSASRKDILYERARQFYLLYLGFFKTPPQPVKIATDLADVYYYQKNFLRSGDLYLRIFSGEFGPATEKEALLQNAILCLQKKGPNDFYEITRSRGLLLKTVQTYMTFNPKKKNDAQLNFVLAKGIYEQGLYTQALPGLVNFVAKFPNATTECEAATDILLDYFNTRSDFKGLTQWSQALLNIRSLSPALRARLQTVKSKALLRQIDEQVKSKANYDPFAQGKVYFETALNMQDETLRSAALEQALARSKAEKDINTFIKAARAVASAEKNPEKRAQILSGMAEQTLAIGRFYYTLTLWKEVTQMGGASAPLKQRIQEKILQLTMMLKDWHEMESASHGVNATLAQSAHSQVAEGMESAALIPEDVSSRMNLHAFTDADMILLFKGMFKASQDVQGRIYSEVSGRCSRAHEGALCRWFHAKDAPKILAQFTAAARSAPSTLESVEKVANALNTYIQQTKDFSDSGDPQLDIFGSFYLAQAYAYFSEFLSRVGAANPQVAVVLKAKANESMQNATREKNQCSKVIGAASLVSPINHYCTTGALPSLKEAMTWRQPVRDMAVHEDPKTGAVEALQKKIFVDATKPEAYLELAVNYYSSHSYHHAIALASYGASTFAQAKDDFAAIQGCGLMKLGLYTEAQFFLKSASDFQSLKAQCSEELKGKLQ
jgi:hypothetical protein